jgi:hypothetical protein
VGWDKASLTEVQTCHGAAYSVEAGKLSRESWSDMRFWKTPNWRFFGKSKNRTTLLKTKEKFCTFLKRRGRTKRKVQEFQKLPITVVQGQAAAHVCGVIN